MATKIYEYADKKIDLRMPKLYKVIMHNDDFTPMDYVVEILVNIFNKKVQEAMVLMLEIHNSDKSVVGTYIYDIAITKKTMSDRLSEEREYPLKITLEEVEE